MPLIYSSPYTMDMQIIYYIFHSIGEPWLFPLSVRMKWTVWLLDAHGAKSRFKASWSNEAICNDKAQHSYLRAVLWLSNTAHYCLYISYCMFTACDYPSTAAMEHQWCPDGSDSDVPCLTRADWLSYAMCETEGVLVFFFFSRERVIFRQFKFYFHDFVMI